MNELTQQKSMHNEFHITTILSIPKPNHAELSEHPQSEESVIDYRQKNKSKECPNNTATTCSHPILATGTMEPNWVKIRYFLPLGEKFKSFSP